MAQVLKLKRTAVQGKVPTTSNIELGELAINTYDGRIFFERDNGNPSIQEIFTTDADITGSLILNGDVTSSNLLVTGDANINGNLTLGGTIYIGDNPSDSVIISAEFSGSLIPDGNEYYDLGASNKKWNNIYVKRVNATTVVAESLSGSFSGSYVGDGSGLVNLPNADVSQVATVTASFDNQSSISVTHNFDSKNVIISVYDTTDAQLIPQSVVLTNNNTATITLSSTQSGYIVVAKGGHIVSGSAEDANNLNGQGGSYYLDYTNFTNIPIGIVSGSTQITDLTTYKEDVSGNLSYAVSHSLNEEYPIVQAWNTSTKKQEIPSEIESTSTNSLTITFNSTFSGKIIVKK